MLTTVKADPFTIRGVSVGGLYTALQVPELQSVLDVGIAPRSFAATRYLFVSHGHPDHMGGLVALLGIRALIGVRRRLRLFVPEENVADSRSLLAAASRLQGYEPDVDIVAMAPGAEVSLRADLRVRAFRTHHVVPSLGYQFLRRVRKLRAEFSMLSEAEIAARRAAGEDADMFTDVDRLELAYATDTLPRMLDEQPEILTSRVLVLECTFLDERKSMEASMAGNHIHLDDLLERAELFQNERLVLMHFSQIYKPLEIPEILERRCPGELADRIVPFAPRAAEWPG